MRKRLTAAVLSAMLMLMSVTPSFAATEYKCSASVDVSGAVTYHTTVSFESSTDLTDTYTQTYRFFGLVYTVTVAVSCAPGT
jgi:hypothetical protein